MVAFGKMVLGLLAIPLLPVVIPLLALGAFAHEFGSNIVAGIGGLPNAADKPTSPFGDELDDDHQEEDQWQGQGQPGRT